MPPAVCFCAPYLFLPFGLFFCPFGRTPSFFCPPRIGVSFFCPLLGRGQKKDMPVQRAARIFFFCPLLGAKKRSHMGSFFAPLRTRAKMVIYCNGFAVDRICTRLGRIGRTSRIGSCSGTRNDVLKWRFKTSWIPRRPHCGIHDVLKRRFKT